MAGALSLDITSRHTQLPSPAPGKSRKPIDEFMCVYSLDSGYDSIISESIHEITGKSLWYNMFF